MTEKKRPSKEEIEMQEQLQIEEDVHVFVKNQQELIAQNTYILAGLQEIAEVLKEISLQIGAVAEEECKDKIGRVCWKGTYIEPKNMPKFTPQEYNALPWVGFTNRKNQYWERFSTAQECGTRNAIKDNLVNACMNPEATIQAPCIIYDYGYWLFRDWLYRREIKGPTK